MLLTAVVCLLLHTDVLLNVYRFCTCFLMISFGCLLVVRWLSISCSLDRIFYWCYWLSIDVGWFLLSIVQKVSVGPYFCLVTELALLVHWFLLVSHWFLVMTISRQLIDLCWFAFGFLLVFQLLLVAYWFLSVSCWFQSLLNWLSAGFLLGFKWSLVAASHSFGLTLHVRISLRFFTYVRNLGFSSICTPNHTSHLVLQGMSQKHIFAYLVLASATSFCDTYVSRQSPLTTLVIP